MSFQGIIPPIVTPFHDDGSIDRDGFVTVLEHLIASGVHGVIIGGTIPSSRGREFDFVLII